LGLRGCCAPPSFIRLTHRSVSPVLGRCYSGARYLQRSAGSLFRSATGAVPRSAALALAAPALATRLVCARLLCRSGALGLCRSGALPLWGSGARPLQRQASPCQTIVRSGAGRVLWSAAPPIHRIRAMKLGVVVFWFLRHQAVPALSICSPARLVPRSISHALSLSGTRVSPALGCPSLGCSGTVCSAASALGLSSAVALLR